MEAREQTDDAVKLSDKRGAIRAEITVVPGIQFYKLTQNGLALQATIQDTKSVI